MPIAIITSPNITPIWFSILAATTVGIVCTAGTLLMFALLTIEEIYEDIQERRVKKRLCPGCAYNASKNTTPNCPECGRDTRIIDDII